MSEVPPRSSKRILRIPEPKKTSSSTRDHPPRKHQRKGENPTRTLLPADCANFKRPKSWICKNSACQASISMDEKFCKRCSCCICHLFDDNKEPSLWLECKSEYGLGESCGLTCHIECALKEGKAGVIDLGQLQLDGSYCCVSCGKVSEIIGNWKKQLLMAKDARRVDTLCFRIDLSYRLLDGTSRFKELHNIVKEAKAKLETEVGPVNSVVMARGIVSRLSVAGALHSLCSLAIEKADEWLAKKYNAATKYKEGSLPVACGIRFEEVKSSSVVIVLVDVVTASSPIDVEGYKLWYCKAGEDTYPKAPNSDFSKCKKRILISDLLPNTEYCFKIVAYTESGDLGHSESKCFTKSPEIIIAEKGVEVCNSSKVEAVKKDHNTPSASSPLDLNVALIPDLNEEPTPESSRDEQCNGRTQQTVDVEDAVSNDKEGNCIAGSHGSGGDSLNSNHLQKADPMAVDSDELAGSRKRAASTNGETLDSDSALLCVSPTRVPNGSGLLGDNFEHCVKTIRRLECGRHITKEFRLNFLSWFSLRSTEWERMTVNALIKALIAAPSDLAEQLVHSFEEIISSKSPPSGYCGKMCH